MLLAQRCPDGFRRADGIVNEVYERDAKNDVPDSVSRFVMHAVRTSREELDPWLKKRLSLIHI